MKVLYAHKNHPVEPLGIGYLSSSTSRGNHESKLILTNHKNLEDKIFKEIEEYQPDILAQSIIFGSHPYAIELNKKVKQKYPNIISVLGGPAATFTPELLERGFDVICRYEGENPFLEFLNALEQKKDVGNIQNLWVKENPHLYKTEIKEIKKILDVNSPLYKEETGYDPIKKRFINTTRRLLENESLDNIPFPDRNLLYSQSIFKNSPIKHFMWTRGCAFHCAYCHVDMMNRENANKGRTVRRRKHEKIAEEIIEVKKNNFLELAYDQSDVMGAAYGVDISEDFANVISDIGIPIHGHVRFDLIARDPKIAKNLAKAGVTGVHVAIEAGSDYIRNKIHRRNMTDEDIITGANYLRENGIKMMTQNILGAPGETKEQMLKTLELNIAVKPTFASASIFQPFPGTKELEYARDSGSLPPINQEELIDMFDVSDFYRGSILILNPEHKKWLETFQKFFALAVSSPSIYTSGVLEKIIKTYPYSEKNNNELELMYRAHRAKSDEELYGVKLNEIVMEEN